MTSKKEVPAFLKHVGIPAVLIVVILGAPTLFEVAQNTLPTNNNPVTVITESEPILREEQDIDRQLALTTAAAQNWSNANYGVTADVYCNQHTDSYASQGWSICDVFVDNRISTLRCQFDLNEVPAQIKACEEL